MEKSDYVLLVIIAVVSFYIVLLMLFPPLMDLIDFIYYYFKDLSITIGYPGAFLLSIFGNSTLFVPIPYLAVIFFLGSSPSISPLLLGIITGIGSGIGELSSYIIGRGGGKLMDTNYSEKLNTYRKLVEQRPMLTHFLIFFFAATPLPDDIILVPLGLINYSWKTSIIPCTLGKIVLTTAIAYAGKYSIEFVEQILNENLNQVEVLTFIGLMIVIVLMVKFDWNRLITSNKIISS